MQPSRAAFIPVLLVAAFLAPMPLLAQWRCQITDTTEQCLDRYLGAYVENTMKEQKRELMTQPTGVDTGETSLATNTKDLTPLMAFSGLLGQSNSTDTQGMALINLNFLIHGLFGPQGSKNAQLQAQINSQPQVSDRIRNTFPKDQRDALTGKLKGQIGDLGDTALLFTYAPATGSLGRNLAQYKDLFNAMCLTAAKRAQPALWTGDTINTAEAIKVLGLQQIPARPNGTMLDIRQVEEKARAVASLQDEAIATAGLTRYYQLVDNQPQLHVTAERKFRDPLVGPDELSVKATYEWGSVNLKDAKKKMACKDWSSEECLDKYTRYMDDNKDSLEKSHRFSFSGEYIDIDGGTVNTSLPDIVPIVFKPVHKLTLSLGWSRNLKLGDAEPVKVDLNADYENVSDDPNRQDRGIVRLTFTPKMGDRMSMPFGIVYANHGEFLSDVDARLSAHIGLKLKITGTSSQ
jgi:hypothetical protein